MKTIVRKNWKWAGHVARMKDNWALGLTKWKATTKRKPSKLQLGWADEITRFGGNKWLDTAKDRQSWSQIEEAFIQQWRNNDCL